MQVVQEKNKEHMSFTGNYWLYDGSYTSQSYMKREELLLTLAVLLTY